MDIRNTISGGVGAICCVYNGMPFDVAKIRMQIPHSQSISQGPLHVMYDIIKKEGFLSLWKGATPALASALIENCVLFTANGAFCSILESLSSEPLSLTQLAFIGGASGIFSATVITPAELVKCTLQNQRKMKQQLHGGYSGPIDCTFSILKKDGFFGLFRGISAVIARDVPFNFFFFGSYAFYSSSLVSLLGYQHKDQLTAPNLLLAGGSAGVTGWSIVFPFDVIKSRVQTQQNQALSTKKMNFSQIARLIYTQHGFAGFYAGWSAAVLRAFPANGSLLMGYELCNRFFTWCEEI